MQTSFDNVGSWIEETNKFAGDNVVKLLVGNKLDLSSKRQVSVKSAKASTFRSNFCSSMCIFCFSSMGHKNCSTADESSM